ncbi:MAG: hypothetical protein O2971_16595 [Proteobacteria bacterium]|nr:hypothetical protein [Pseudomonadota bacterium]
MTSDWVGATGVLASYVPEGPDRNMLLSHVRFSVIFQGQHGRGKRNGALNKAVQYCIGRVGPTISLRQLVDELEIIAANHPSMHIAGVDRFAKLILVDVKGGTEEIQFASLYYHLTKARKELFSNQPPN